MDTQPHLRHYVLESGIRCPDSKGESLYRLLAKTLLCDYLNSGGVVTFQDGEEVPKLPLWRLEVGHNSNKCRFDIGGFNAAGDVTFGVEIWHSHKTDNVEPRTIPWIEVKSSDVIDLLSVLANPAYIFLVDCKQAIAEDELPCVSENTRPCSCHTIRVTKNCNICANVGKRICKSCGCFDLESSMESHHDTCVDCYDRDGRNKSRGWRQCIRCHGYVISTKAPPFVLMCYSCQDSCTHEERNEANKLTGWRECFCCNWYKVHPKSPQYYNLCEDCQDITDSELIEQAHVAAGWKECERCSRHEILPQLKYSLCKGCCRKCHTQGCDNNIDIGAKKYCAVHRTAMKVPTKKRYAKKKPKEWAVRPDYRNDGGEETYCSVCNERTMSDWKPMCTRCFYAR